MLFVFIAFFFAYPNTASSQTINVKWPLTLWEVPTITGNVNAANQLAGSGIGTISYWTSGSYSAGWNTASRNTSDYYEYSIIPYSGLSLTINSVSFALSVNSGTMISSAYWSVDGFTTSTRLGATDFSVSTTENITTISGLSVNVSDGKTFTVRIYGWAATTATTEFRNKDVTIEGTTSCATVTVTAAASSASVCSGETINLSSTGPTGSTGTILLREDFNGTMTGWTTINQSTGGTVEDAAWKLQPDGYYYYFDFHSNDNSQFLMTNSHVQGSGTTTTTILQSPKMSTIGNTTLSMEFYHYFDSFKGDIGRVQVSSDNINWKDVAFFTTMQGSANAFARYSVNLDAYVGLSSLWIRFRYVAKWGWWWAIDNVTIGSLSSSYTINWSSSPVGFASQEQNPQGITPSETTIYTVQYTSGSGCNGSASTTVTVSQGTTAPVAPAEQDFCSAVTVADLQATAPTGSTVRWYTTATGGTPLTPETTLSTGTYYAESYNSSSCYSQTRTPVAVDVNAVPGQPSVITGETAVCSGSLLTYSVANIAGVTYNWVYPSGWIQTSGGNTNTVTVTAGNSAGNIEVTPVNGCGSGPARSLAVTLASPVVPAISVSANYNPVCSGETVLFTAAPTNGGIAPSFQWNVNGEVVAGAAASTYSFNPAAGDLVSCTLTSSEPCASPVGAESNLISMEIRPSVVPSVTITADQNPICSGAEVTFTAVLSNGGTTPVFQWKVNGANVGTSTSTYRYPPNEGDVVTCEITSSDACANPASATSNQVVMQVGSSLQPEIVITADQDPVCEGKIVNFTSMVKSGGVNPLYQWIVNGSNVVSANSSNYAYVPKADDVVECQLISSDPCAGSTPVLSNKLTIVFGPTVAPSVTISTTRMPICPNEPVKFTSSVTNGGTTPGYQWRVNGATVEGAVTSEYTFIPDNGDEVTCEVSSSLSCATPTKVTSNLIRVTVSPSIVPVINISADQTVVCEGDIVHYSSSIINGGPTPAYQWRVNGVNISGETNSSLDYAPIAGAAVTCRLTSSESCALPQSASSNSIKVTVNPVAIPEITIIADQNEVCEGAMITFTATIANGGTTPGYQWFVNDDPAVGATGEIYSYIAADGDQVTCRLTSNATCANPMEATSNTITMLVVPLIYPSITISPSVNPVCPGQEVTLSATTSFGGTTPTYIWFVNGEERGTTASLTIIPQEGDRVWCEFISSLDCAEPELVLSDTVLFNLRSTITPEITISVDQSSVCAGTKVNFVVDAINVGDAPIFQWQVNGIDIGANLITFNYTPQNGDSVTCTVTSDDPCASPREKSSLPIIIQVENKVTPTIQIVADQNEVCEGDTIHYVATISYGGTAPTYQWIVNGIPEAEAINSTFSYAAKNGDIISCQLTSNADCATPLKVISNSITMTMGPPIYPSIQITASENPVCPEAEVTFSSITHYGGPSPIYRWLVNGFEVASAVPGELIYVPNNSDTVSCEFTSSLDCPFSQVVSSNQIIITHSSSLIPSVSITSDQNPICEGSPVIFTAVANYGGTAPQYQWQVNGVDFPDANQATFVYPNPGDGEVVRCRIISNDPCVSTKDTVSLGDTLVVVDELIPKITISSDLQNVCEGESVTYQASTTDGGTSPAFQWQVNGIDVDGPNGDQFTFQPNTGDEVTCVLISSAPCANPVTVPSNGIIVEVTETVTPSVSITESQNPVCAGTEVVFTAVPVNEGDAPLFSWRVNGIILPEETAEVLRYTPVDGEVIACELFSSVSCPSAPSVLSNNVPMSVLQRVTPDIVISVDRNPVCAGDSVTLTANVMNGGITPAFQWKVNSTPVAGATSAQFSYTPIEGDVVSCDLMFEEACLSNSALSSNEITISYKTDILPAINILALQNPVCPNTPVSFVSSVSNTGSTPAYQWKVNTVNIEGAVAGSFTSLLKAGDLVSCDFSAEVECGGRVTVESNMVTVEHKELLSPLITISSDLVPICEGGLVNLTASITNGGPAPLYQWRINDSLQPISSSPNYRYAPSNGDQVSCQLISNDPCAGISLAESNVILFEINPSVAPKVTISAYREPACPGTPATFVAISTNTGFDPAYRWLVNEQPVIGEFTDTYIYIPVDGDRVICIITSSDPCANPATVSSNELLMTIRDDQSPKLTCPSNLNDIPADEGQCFATLLTLGVPEAIDDCGSVTLVNDAPAQFPIGTTTVIWTATDLAGNATTCRQTITVIDNQPPEITCPPDLQLVTPDANSIYLDNVDLGTPLVSDNCIVATLSNDAPARFPLGLSTVSWSVTDAFGNIANCPQQVSVIQPLIAMAGNDTLIGACETLLLDSRRSTGPIALLSWSLLTEGALLTEQPNGQASFGLSSNFDFAALPHQFEVLLQIVGTEGQIDSDTLLVTVDQAPEAVALQPGTPDLSGRLLLDGSTSRGTSLSFFWSTTDGLIEGGPDGALITVVSTGSYILEVTDQYGCSSDDTIEVAMAGQLLIANDDYVRTSWLDTISIRVLDNDFDAYNGIDPTSIKIVGEPQYGSIEIGQDGSLIYSPEARASGTDKFGYRICNYGFLCDTAEVTITLIEAFLLIPEGLSPNGDGLNDQFVIEGLDAYPATRLAIYTRAGQLVFRSDDYQNNWGGHYSIKGTPQGQLVPQGVYYYILRLGETNRKLKGFVYVAY